MSTIVKNKKLAAGVGVAAAAAAVIALGAGTYAAFFAVENAPTTTLASGTLYFGESQSTTPIKLGPLTPGGEIEPQSFTFTNGGNLTGVFGLDFTVTGTEEGCAGDSPATRTVEGPENASGDDCRTLVTDGVGGGDLDDQVNVTVSDGATTSAPVSLAQLADVTSRSLAPAGSVTLTLKFTFQNITTGSGNNAAQGDRATITAVARLDQS